MKSIHFFPEWAENLLNFVGDVLGGVTVDVLLTKAGLSPETSRWVASVIGALTPDFGIIAGKYTMEIETIVQGNTAVQIITTTGPEGSSLNGTVTHYYDIDSSGIWHLDPYR